MGDLIRVDFACESGRVPSVAARITRKLRRLQGWQLNAMERRLDAYLQDCVMLAQDRKALAVSKLGAAYTAADGETQGAVRKLLDISE